LINSLVSSVSQPLITPVVLRSCFASVVISVTSISSVDS
jgi:hypothetical protein